MPIAGNPWWDQDNTYLDFNPGPEGASGQIVIFGKGVFGAYQGPGFGEALELFVTGLEKGDWSYLGDGDWKARSRSWLTWPKYVKARLG